MRRSVESRTPICFVLALTAALTFSNIAIAEEQTRGGGDAVFHTPEAEAVLWSIFEVDPEIGGKPSPTPRATPRWPFKCPPGTAPFLCPITWNQICIGPDPDDNKEFKVCVKVGREVRCVKVQFVCDENGNCKVTTYPLGLKCPLEKTGTGEFRVECHLPLIDRRICVEYRFEGSGSEMRICSRPCFSDKRHPAIPIETRSSAKTFAIRSSKVRQRAGRKSRNDDVTRARVASLCVFSPRSLVTLISLSLLSWQMPPNKIR